MDIVNYVNKVGQLINDHVKYSVKLDIVSIENLVIINHFNDLINKINEDVNLTEEQKTEVLDKINNYINCLKKEINFYPEKVIVPDCILTEVEEHVIQE